MVSTTSTKRYSIVTIKEEARNLLATGAIALNQPLRILFEYLPPRQWDTIESELELHDYLLRDRVIDLIGKLDWEDD